MDRNERIREMYATSGLPQKVVAQRFGVSQSQVSVIVRGDTRYEPACARCGDRLVGHPRLPSRCERCIRRLAYEVDRLASLYVGLVFVRMFADARGAM